jgi:6-pyruvoyltetrahydropterin/6-carboxytetrahydropterin synthase
VRELRLTKRIEFSAAHRYWRDDWDAARNRELFGASAQEHGHNYMLEVTVVGAVDPQTGMVVNLYDLKRVLKELLEEFDHKHLNLDTPYFKQGLPTGEHVAGVLWRLLARRREIGQVERIRLYDDEDGCVDVTAPDMAAGGQFPVSASVIRRYTLPERSGTGAPVAEFFVTVHGPVDPDRGQVVDPPALDRLVRDRAVLPLSKGSEARSHGVATGERLARDIWSRLKGALPAGRLRQIRLMQTPDRWFEYAG